MANQDPKKFPWIRRESKKLSGKSLAEKVKGFVRQKAKYGIQTVKSDVWHLARLRGLKPFSRVVSPDGIERFIGEDGIEVARPKGLIFVPSRRAMEKVNREAV